MNKHNCFWAITVAAMLALTGCGVQEPGEGDDGMGDGAGDSGSNGQTSDYGNGGTNGWENLGGADAGTDTGTVTGDAGAPAADAGATPPADGGSGGSDAGSPAADAGAPPTDAGSPPADGGSGGSDAGITPMPAPVSSPAALQFRFADTYIGAAACGQVRGNLPGTTWSSGPTMSDRDGDHLLEVGYASIPAGTYELSYVSAACPGGPAVTENWASYGARPQLLGMTENARSFVSCNWWDAATGTAVTVASPGCNLRISVDAMGVITGAGNMRNYH